MLQDFASCLNNWWENEKISFTLFNGKYPYKYTLQIEVAKIPMSLVHELYLSLQIIYFLLYMLS